jgi:lysophospholipase L1-like esterase
VAIRKLPPLAAFLFLAAVGLLPVPAHAQTPSSPLYVALGDSLAFGVGASSPQDDGYVALAADALRSSDHFGGTGLDVVNLSSPGARTADLLEPRGQVEAAIAEIEARAEDQVPGNDVRLISINAGANDLLALVDPGQPCVENAGSEACRDSLTGALIAVQQNLAEALRRLREAAPGADIYVMDLYNPYSGSGEEFEILASVGVQQLNGVIGVAAASEEFGATLVPVFELFQGRANQWIAQDGIHPNNDGYRVLAEALLAAIEQRPAVIPEDLRALPTEPPVVTVVEGDGIEPIVFWIALPVVFLAGAALSSAYFLMRRG